MKIPVQLGFDAEYRTSVYADFDKVGMTCIVGGTGSGKTICTLYILYKLLRSGVRVELYIGDFKKSGDYAGISPVFAEFADVTQLILDYYSVFESTPENYAGIKILILDEYAGYITWLSQKDKKLCDEIKGKISNLLMLGRSRHCFVWCIQQRMTATLFPAGIGAIDNFQVCIGLSRLSPDSRRSLFSGEYPDDTPFIQSFSPGTGQGLVLIDGQGIRPFAVPRIDDKEKLKALCRKYAR